MAFLLSARWPNGTYLGHRPDGSPEAMPTFARVFSALVHAAGTGTEATAAQTDAVPGRGRLSTASVDALRWLESHPPCAMVIPSPPDFLPSTAVGSFQYRAEGVFQKEGGRTNYKRTPRTIATASWIGAPIQWLWDETPPAGIRSQLDRLCADVGTLGEADSPAILEIDVVPDTQSCTHDLVAASFFDEAGDEVAVPAPGRLEALEEQFAAARPRKRPSVAQDKHAVGASAMPHSEPPTSAALRRLRLVPRQRASAEVPWDTAILLPIDDGPLVKPKDRVAMAVALHRALISVVGQDCPAVITGRYRSGDTPPSNRVALHYLPADAPIADGNVNQPHFLVLQPRGMVLTDAVALHQGVARLRTLRTRRGKFSLGTPLWLPGDQCWAPPAEREERDWRLDPAAIPERSVKASSPTTVLQLTAARSLANVWRGLDPELADLRPAECLQWLRDRGGEIVEVAPLWVDDPAQYVHRTKRVIPVMPYTGRLVLGGLAPDTAVLALGQSRHLGGGLLVPVDRPQLRIDDHA